MEGISHMSVIANEYRIENKRELAGRKSILAGKADFWVKPKLGYQPLERWFFKQSAFGMDIKPRYGGRNGQTKQRALNVAAKWQRENVPDLFFWKNDKN